MALMSITSGKYLCKLRINIFKLKPQKNLRKNSIYLADD